MKNYLKNSFLITMIMCLAFFTEGQVLMERTYPFGTGAVATSGVLLKDSTYLVSYMDTRYVSRNAAGKGVLRIKSDLDTISSFVFPEIGYINQIISLSPTIFLTVGTTNNINSTFKGRADCYDLNYTSTWSLVLDSLIGNVYVTAACKDTNDFVYICGYQDIDSIRFFNRRIFCLRMTSFGVVDWFKFYDWGSPLQASYSIAQMENGNFMVGGTTGALIVGMELDENGNRVTPLTTFFTPNRPYYNTNTLVQPLPGNRYLIRGLQQAGYVCFAITDRQGNAFYRDWRYGGIGLPYVHAADGSFTISREDSNLTNHRIERIRSDGTLIWSLPYPQPTTPRGHYRAIYGILPSYDGNGLAYGFFDQGRTRVLLAKIANVGYPAPPLSTPLSVQVQAVSAYPNPTTGAVVLGIPSLVAGHAASVVVDALDMRGVRHQLLASNDLGGYRLDLSALPAGLYHLSLVVGGQRYVARVVRE